jgi:murein tripeptide amidase MpaA
MDVMIPPSLVNSTEALFPLIPHEISIENVQHLLDRSEEERKLSRKDGDFFSDFQTYGAIYDWLLEQSAVHSAHAKVISIGTSYQGDDIWAMHMKKGQAKPVVLLHCGIHAREWITPASCCWIINDLLSDQKLLDSFEIYIIPVLNIDGYEYTQTNDRLWRKNRQPSSRSSCIGTDLNRNFAYAWSAPGASSNPCAETYYGDSAFSGKEVAVLRDFISKIQQSGKLVSYFDIHAYSAMWMSPWGYSCNLPSDYTVMQRTMNAAVTAVKGEYGHAYEAGSICRVIYQSSGSSIDYTYAERGVVHSYAVEAYGTNFNPPTSYIPMVGAEICAGVKQTLVQIQQTL